MEETKRRKLEIPKKKVTQQELDTMMGVLFKKWEETPGMSPELTPVLGSFADMDFTGLSFMNLHLDGATFARCIFDGCDLRYASLKNTHMKDCSFLGAACQQTQFCGTYLFRSVLEDADIRGAKFTGATLTGVKFIDCDVSEDTDFTNSNTEDALFIGTPSPMKGIDEIVTDTVADASRKLIEEIFSISDNQTPGGSK